MSTSARMNSAVPPMPDDMACQVLPYIALRLMYGAKVEKGYAGRADLVQVFYHGQEEVLHVDDFVLAEQCAKEVWERCVTGKVLEGSTGTPAAAMELHNAAAQYIQCRKGQDRRKRALLLLSDQYGCGYWRMMLPATHIVSDKWLLDISPSEVGYDYLRSYDTVMLQRVCNWNSYYIVKRLLAVGVRVIYDLDDNLWELPKYHPAYNKFGTDEKEAAKAIIKIASAVTVTTTEMAYAIIRHCGIEVQSKIVIIPNATDIKSFPLRPAYPLAAEGDSPFRILWAGSATHEQDFNVCIGALDQFMLNHEDDAGIRIMFMGFLPSLVTQVIQQNHWFNKVEHVDFQNIETYFSLLCKIKADIAIAPLVDCPFNSAKSNIKWIEYTLAGIPVLASNVGPYTSSIMHGRTGFLAGNQEGWLSVLEDKYAHRVSQRWQQMVNAARVEIAAKYDITLQVPKWLEVLGG